jgi:RNA polymerase-binding transcription factor DksA
VTAQCEASCRGRGDRERQRSALRAERCRALLEAALTEQRLQFARHAAALATFASSSCGDATGLDRAVIALQAYRVRETIEAIEGALLRIDGGDSGTCQSCTEAIPLELVEAIRDVRLCTACSARVVGATRARSGAAAIPGVRWVDRDASEREAARDVRTT